MSKTATMLTERSLQDLYLHRLPPPSQLILQILAYQVSEFNPKEIILRISDGESFVDCLLVGPYRISDSKIVSNEHNRSSQVFKCYDLVKVTDYFCKIDTTKICQLRIIIRKLEETGGTHPTHALGKPEEISEFIENIQIKNKPTPTENNKLINFGSQETPIKLEELPDEPYRQPQHQNYTTKPSTQAEQKPQKEQPLTLQEILGGKTGYFIGRLVRMKFGCKQAKDGPMSFLYLGFLDAHGSLVRIHLAGRIAIKEQKQLRKGRVYFIKGLQLFQGEKTRGGPQIRLKDKDYKIYQIQNQAVKAQYKQTYYLWEHQNEWVESEMVDVVGVVEGIEERISYKNTNTYQEQRDVVRLAIKNAFKTVKISFWADHIAIVENLQLQRKQPILIQDIKKKKTIFLDFISESNITLLDQHPDLLESFAAFLPPLEDAPDPHNIQQLLNVCSIEPYSSKVRPLTLRIAAINQKWVTYKMCNHCKKKVEKVLEACLECQQSDFVYKYNCALELTDASGTLSCIAFDAVCEKLFKCSASEFSALNEEQITELCDSLTKEIYRVGIEFKNNRQIIRTMEEWHSESAPKGEGEVEQNSDMHEE